MIYQLVHQLQKEAIPVQQSCRVLDVSRSGYYDARRRSAKPVVCKISVHLKAEFQASQHSYGSRRLVTAMANAGFRIRALQGAQPDASSSPEAGLETQVHPHDR
jgi:hypothetical protein